MKISVVIPAFNAERTIRRAIDSVLEQNLRPFEVIVVDDGSTDSTRELVESYGGITKCISQPNAGASAARNVGIDAATGEWIAFLDADDEWLPDRLRLQNEILQRHPDLVWCSGAYQERRRRENHDDCDTSTICVNASVDGVIPDALEQLGHSARNWNGVIFWTGTISVLRSALLEVTDPSFGSYFDLEQRSSHDLDLWLRLAIRFPKVGYCEQPIAVYHLGSTTSLTGSQTISSDRTVVLFSKRGYEMAGRLEAKRSHQIKSFVDVLSRVTCNNAFMAGHIEDGKWLFSEYRKLGVPLPKYLAVLQLLPTRFASLIVRTWRSLRVAS